MGKQVLDGIIIDLNRLSYEDYRDWIAEEDDADPIALLVKVVVEWDLPGEPSDPKSYLKMGMVDFLRVQRVLRNMIDGVTRELDGESDASTTS